MVRICTTHRWPQWEIPVVHFCRVFGRHSYQKRKATQVTQNRIPRKAMDVAVQVEEERKHATQTQKRSKDSRKQRRKGDVSTGQGQRKEKAAESHREKLHPTERSSGADESKRKGEPERGSPSTEGKPRAHPQKTEGRQQKTQKKKGKMVTSGLKKPSTAKQVSTLLYCMGDDSEAVLSSTNPMEDDRKTYDGVMTKFESFVVSFNYGEKTPEMIRDRLVVGIRDDTISRKLQLEPDLTLKTAKKKIRQEEVVWEQQQSLKERDTVSIQVVNGDQASVRLKRSFATDVEEKDTTASNVIHGGLAEVTGDKAVDSAYLDALTTKQNSSWMSAVLLNNKKVRFKLDIRAEVTAISQETKRVARSTSTSKRG
ncbi:hypothetical protein EMCRGX_G005606 [Ephydatia muelleri]